MPPNSALLDRYKLSCEFASGSVTHRTVETDLSTRRRRIKVASTWVHDRKLGAGAFGEVMLQREKTSGKLRAVKVIAKAQLRTNELRTLIELQNHRDLFVAFLGWYEDPCVVYIAMEYIEHGDLGQYIADDPVKARSEAKNITAQILEGLVILHQREICHRDLKPQTILMVSLSPLWLKITDFGIAKRWGGTELRTQCGTVIYKAPELLGLLPRDMRPTGQSYTPSIDIWALGAVVHQVLTSDVPFTDTSLPIGDSTDMTASEWASIDGELMMNYCAGREPFPNASLNKHGASPSAIRFVKSLMVADPKSRVSAADALKCEWLARIRSSPAHQLYRSPQDPISQPAVDQDLPSLPTMETVPSNGMVNLILLMGKNGCGKSLGSLLLTSRFWVQLIIGAASQDSHIDYSTGLQRWLDKGVIIHLDLSPSGNSVLEKLALANQIQWLALHCVPYFTNGMIVGVGRAEQPNKQGIFANKRLSITEATSPRCAVMIQCMAVVREILRQQAIAVASAVPFRRSKYLFQLAGAGIERNLFMDLDAVPEAATAGVANQLVIGK